MGVSIQKGIIAWDEAKDVPRHEWDELVRTRLSWCRNEIRGDCRGLLFFIEDAAKHDWLGFKDRDEYLTKGLGFDDAAIVEWAVEGLRRIYDEMSLLEFEERGVISLDDAVALGKHGGDRKSDKAKEDQGSVTTLVSTQGRGVAYNLARLKRDAPELAEKVIAGELSANAAAIEAGFRKKTWQAPDDIEGLAKAIEKRYGGEWVLKKN